SRWHMRMVISAKTSVTIGTAIENVLSDADADKYIYKFEEPIDIRPIVERETVLPMMFDWCGFYGLRTNAEIVYVDLGPPVKIRPEIDPRIMRMVLCQGVKRYPELVELTPVKPSDALTCLSCNGTGRHPANDEIGFEDERIVCWCGGLGWITKGEYQPIAS
ncbi:MAG: hypothetical protein AAB288_09710, partial [Acidobacteriota bacterium]